MIGYLIYNYKSRRVRWKRTQFNRKNFIADAGFFFWPFPSPQNDFHFHSIIILVIRSFEKKLPPPCLHEYLRLFCFDLSKLCEIHKQLENIYPALLSISFYLYSFRNESILKMHMHFGWGKRCPFTLVTLVTLVLLHYPFPLYFFAFSFIIFFSLCPISPWGRRKR